MNWTTKHLTSQIQRFANFIVLEGRVNQFVIVERSEGYTDLTTYALIGGSYIETTARKSSAKIYSMYLNYKDSGDFIASMDMAREIP